MATEGRSLTGTTPTQQSAPGLSFPRRLVHPPKSQVARSEDAVTNRIVQLDTHGQQLGEAFGIPFTSFVLNPLTPPSTDITQLAMAVATLLHREERIALERRGGRWGLYFSREAAVVQSYDKKTDPVPLKDAPLDVRERFLVKSEEFFRAYLDLCRNRLEKMHASVAQGDKTLALLRNLPLVE